MANLIQVKRSTTNSTPASLTAGELAYSFLNTSNSLFVGNTSAGGPIRIAGGNYAWLYQANTSQPGGLTANAVVLTNGNSFVTNWKTNALTVGVDGATVSISNIATFANTTQLGNAVGGSNTELVSSWAIKTYIDNNAARLPNTYVAFGANSVANGGSSGFTFDSTNLILSVGNTTVNTQISQTAITTTATVSTGNVNTTGVVNASIAINVGANVTINTTSYEIGNATSNSVLTATFLTVGNTTTGTVNAFALNISGVVASGNATVTGFINASSYGTFNGVVNATSLNSTGATTSTFANNVTITGTANVSSGINVGANVVLSTTSVSVGNATVNTQITAGTIKLNGSDIVIGNTATNTSITGTSVTIGGTTSITNTLATGNTTVTGFVNVSTYGTFGGTVNAAALNISGLVATGNTTTTGFINVSSYGTFGGTVNAAALNVSGLVAKGNTTTTGFVNVSSYGTFGGQVNATSFNSTSATTSTFANNVTISGTTNTVSLNVTGDATISGNLYVTGNLVSINVATLAITDSLIQLATNNNITPDVLDVGLFGNYGLDANTNNHRHTGLFRDASDSKWKLFDNLLPAPTTTVDTTNSTFNYATLQTHLSAGGTTAAGLIANSSTIAITANSTLNVAFVANTLTLSTALAGTSGGTGLATLTTEDILVANASNGFRKLNVGTEGYVLQVASGVVAWNTLDGGSF